MGVFDLGYSVIYSFAALFFVLTGILIKNVSDINKKEIEIELDEKKEIWKTKLGKKKKNEKFNLFL